MKTVSYAGKFRVLLLNVQANDFEASTPR